MSMVKSWLAPWTYSLREYAFALRANQCPDVFASRIIMIRIRASRESMPMVNRSYRSSTTTTSSSSILNCPFRQLEIVREGLPPPSFLTLFPALTCQILSFADAVLRGSKP
eukprot:3941776-Rhodomonas_salina.5